MQGTQEFFMWKTPTLTVEIQNHEFKTSNLNPQYKIKSYKITWLLYFKDLLFRTHNLLHIHDATIFNCSNEFSSTLVKRYMYSNNSGFNVLNLSSKIRNGKTSQTKPVLNPFIKIKPHPIRSEMGKKTRPIVIPTKS